MEQVFLSEQVLTEYDSQCTFTEPRYPNGSTPPHTQTQDEQRALKRHWSRRHEYFSKFDSGILMDRTGWYSVTPEAVAAATASKVPPGNIVYDGFVGVGGNAIQFALNGSICIGSDIDAGRLKFAQNNCRVYGVTVDLILGDYFCIAKWMRADVVFLSPPWGGPECNALDVFRITGGCSCIGVCMCTDQSGPACAGQVASAQSDGAADEPDTALKVNVGFASALKVTPNIIIFLPRHTSISDLASLAPVSFFKVQKHYTGKRFVALSVYYGELFLSKRQLKKIKFNC